MPYRPPPPRIPATARAARLARRRERRKHILSVSVAMLLLGGPALAETGDWYETARLLAQTTTTRGAPAAESEVTPTLPQGGNEMTPEAMPDERLEEQPTGEPRDAANAAGEIPKAEPVEPRDDLPAEMNLMDLEGLFPEGDPTGDASRSFLRSAWKFWFYGDVRVVATDNLFIQEHGRQSDVSLVLSPGFAIGRGAVTPAIRELFGFRARVEDTRTFTEKSTYFYFSYTPTESIFFKHSDQDTLDHDVVLAGELVLPRLRLSLRTRYQTLSSAELDVGTRIERRVFTGEADAEYQITEKTSTEIDFHADNTTYPNGDALDNTTWTVGGFLNYRFTPKLETSAGVNVGLLQVKSSPDQYFEQALLRTRWTPTDKLSVSLLAGVEWREVDGGKDNTEPIFALTLAYQPRARTTLQVRAERHTYNSASLFDEDYTVTTFAVGVRQDLFAHMDFNLNVAYYYSDYFSLSNGPATSRTDNVFEVTPTLGLNVTRWSRLELSYQFRRNSSTEAGESFRENVGRLDMKVLF